MNKNEIMRNVTLVLEDGTKFHGKSFGYEKPVAGEVVFNTAMMGYPESLTDPSYAGQLMTLTYPLVGNYGVPPFTVEPNGIATFMESDKIYASAIIVADYSTEYSHWNAKESLAEWLKREQVPGITGIDTRELTKVLREHGVMLIFSEEDDIESVQLFEPEFRPCAFEYVYFARPDSVIDGKNVYTTRENMGKALAINDANSKIKYDMVVPVPDSGVPAALGYAAQSGIPFKYGIIRNHYIGRTFIEPTQEMRNLKVKMKLSPMSSIIAGKSLLVIDDSIVRGTTSKRIVKMLKEAGAKEVHFRVASPEIKFPCFYGIDTPTKEELISTQMKKDEVCKYIEADSLEYLSIDDLVNAIGNDRHYALESFDGDYFVKA